MGVQAGRVMVMVVWGVDMLMDVLIEVDVKDTVVTVVGSVATTLVSVVCIWL